MREALFFKLDSNVQGLTRRTSSYGRMALAFGTHSEGNHGLEYCQAFRSYCN
jgi:hypothetical protein